MLFARSPRVGAVKTRLAPAIGPTAAARLHQALLRHSAGCVAASGLPATLCSDGEIDIAPDWPRRAQRGTDLGERMRRALLETVAEGAAPILIGSDCPDIDAAYLHAAASALAEGAALVLGPAEDGGYGLIGCRGAVPDQLFQGISWGSDSVLRDTLARASACGLRTRLLKEIWDVDRPADLQRLADSHPDIVREAGLEPGHRNPRGERS